MRLRPLHCLAIASLLPGVTAAQSRRTPRHTRVEPAAEGSIRAAIRTRSPTDHTITQAGEDRCVASLQDLLRQVRAHPVERDGQTAGIALTGLRPEHPLWLLGLREGDLVREVNGYAIGEPSQALLAYAMLRSAQQFQIGVERAGRPLTLTIRVVP